MPLFDGRTEAAQLARFESTLGPIPADMLAASSKTSKFYSGGAQGGYKLKEALLPRRSLETVLGVTTGGPRGSRKGTAGHDVLHYQEFLDFIEKLLRYRPEERISCEDALRHPFLLPLYTAEQTTGDQAKHKPQETAT
ncbi:hypothetical protein AGDE_15778 [Angomonas deanei]|uniref:Protein kinase domain containing protein n=1 Tax=Angomonas deanei TaxID=59799 RepID=A0A7G2CUE3_9TRYP|nr:hypothetical protein AGDE_15778 [Angomonas deanei]CAD2221862.1 hypothetical protein, conserved [Angomonas deanei]|eukprot:EPY18443.1 hypothetical protein AGDE_15778 [Angomonas deanei]